MRRKTDEANNTGLQTKRVGRGEKVRFTYNMPTATDQEIIVYAGHYLKSLGDVSNLQPTSMLIANADRLTEIECHSPNLINTDLSECTKLQRIDLSDCTALGTGIGAQPILNIQNCKYLRYCDCRNTQLTAIYTMQAGGNLEEIYYPQSTQVVQLTNQTYLHTIGLPSTSPCKNLANVQITNCNAVKRLSSETTALDFNTFKYVQNLNITNSLSGLDSMNFNGFDKLRNVTLSSLKELDTIGFEDMMPVTTTSTLKNITISDCPLITSLSFNVSSDDYKVAFASGGKLDLGGLQLLKSIECNTSVKGLDTLIVPTSLTDLRFTTEYGDGINDIKNIWSDSAVHNDDGFEGIDFLDMTIEFIDMLGLSSMSNAINFHIAPKTQNPNLNTARDGSESKPWFHPIGSINLSNYTGSMIGMLKGVDLNKLDVVINTNKTQTDLSYLFYGAIGTNTDVVDRILSCFPDSTVWDYMFAASDKNTDYDLPLRLTSVIGTFKDTTISEYLENWNKTYDNGITATDCYAGTSGYLDDVTTAWGGYGFYKENTGIYVLEIPRDNYEIRLYGHYYGLTKSIFLSDKPRINWGDGNISTIVANTEDNGVHTYEKAGTYIVKAQCCLGFDSYEPTSSIKSTLVEVRQIPIMNYEGSKYPHFSGCTKLRRVEVYNHKPIRCDSLFRGCSSLTELIGIDTWDMSNCTSIAFMFNGCSSLTDYSFFTSMDLTSCTTIQSLFANNANVGDFSFAGFNFNPDIELNIRGCFEANNNLTSVDFTGIPNNADDFTNLLRACKNLTSIRGLETLTFRDGCIMSNMISEGALNKIEEIDLSFITCKPSRLTTFSNDGNTLKTIKMGWDCINVYPDYNYGMNYAFSGFYSLQNIEWCKNIKYMGDITMLNRHTGLTTQTLVGLMNALYDYAGAGDTDYHTCSISSTSLAKLTDEQKMIAVNKGWFLTGYNTRRIPAGMDASGLGINNDITKLYIELTSENATSRIAELYSKYPNITEIYLFEDGSITEAVDIFTGVDNSAKAQITKVVFMEGYFNNVTLDKREYGILDEVPVAWGGFGFSKDVTSIIVVEIPSDNYEMSTYGGGGSTHLDDGLVKWGDGSTTSLYDTHTYATAGTYIIKCKINKNGFIYSGKLKQTAIEIKQLASSIVGNGNYSSILNGYNKLTKATVYNLAPTNCAYMFQNCSSLTEIVGLNTWDMSNCINVADMFTGCNLLTSIELYNLAPTDCGGMFRSCSSLTELVGMDTWNMSNCTSFSETFLGCSSLTDEVFNTISNWQFGVSFVLYGTFKGTNITNLDFATNWDMSKCTSLEMTCMGCSKLVNADGLTKHTMNLVKISRCFEDCSSLDHLDFTGIKAETWKGAFSRITNCKYIIGLDMSDSSGSYEYAGLSGSWVVGCGGMSNLTSIKNWDFSFTKDYDGLYLTNDYWIDLAWVMFRDNNSLTDITFTGTIHIFDELNDYKIFAYCDTSKFTRATWESFVTCCPTVTTTKSLYLGKNQANLDVIPDDIKEALVNKGYTLVYG